MAEGPWTKYQEPAQSGPWVRYQATAVTQPAPPEAAAQQAEMTAAAASAQGVDPNVGIGPIEAFKIGAGRGLANIGRAVGLSDPEDPLVTAQYERLQSNRPVSTGVGQITGEAGPFLPFGMGVGAIRATGPRILAATGVGALEGGTIAAGRGQDFNEILDNASVGGVVAGGLEAAFPIIGRLGSEVVSRATGKAPRGAVLDRRGNPTPELTAALKKLNMSFGDLAQESVFVLKNSPPGVNPEDALRAARFKQLGIPASRGNITQDFAQQAQEERLVNTTLDASQPMRALQLEQSQKFEQGINDLVASLGVTEETGSLVKGALSGLEAGIKSDKNELYRRMAEESPQVMNIPIIPNRIKGALPDAAQLRRVSRIPGNTVEALQDLLVEFGIDNTPEAVEAFTKSGGKVMPLTLGNMEEFRAALNQLGGSPSAQSAGERAMSGIVGRLKGALDEEAGVLEKSLLDANVTNTSVLEPLREARSLVVRLKTEFSPQSIVGRLTDVKQDGVTPMVEASRVYDSILGRSQPVEYLDRTLKALNEAGPQGRRAVEALQAETVLRALDSALKAPSRKTSGIQTIGYSQFVKALDSLGEEKLNLLFPSGAPLRNKLEMFRGAANDLTPDARATPRGSAPVIMDVLNRMGRSPGIAAFVDTMKFVVNAGADDRAVRQAMNARPEVKRVITHIKNDYPFLASALGIAALSVEEEK
jgi:hypothetical protein